MGPPEAAAAKAREALVMELLREARISQGKAAALLGVGRGEILDLVARYKVPSGALTAEEWGQGMTVVDRLLKERDASAGGQRQ